MRLGERTTLMKCTYCKSNGAVWRPQDLGDERRACEWCVLKVEDRDEWLFILEETDSQGGRWFSLQELQPLRYANLTRVYLV